MTLVQEVEQKVKEIAHEFHAVETKVLQEIIDFLVKQPFESVNGLLAKLHKSAKPVQLTEVPASPAATPVVEAEPTNIELPLPETPVSDAEIVTPPTN